MTSALLNTVRVGEIQFASQFLLYTITAPPCFTRGLEKIRATNMRGVIFPRFARAARENSPEQRWRVSRIFPRKIARSAEAEETGETGAKGGKLRKGQRREGMKILPGGRRTSARHASHGLVPPTGIPVRNTKAQRRVTRR